MLRRSAFVGLGEAFRHHSARPSTSGWWCSRVLDTQPLFFGRAYTVYRILTTSPSHNEKLGSCTHQYNLDGRRFSFSQHHDDNTIIKTASGAHSLDFYSVNFQHYSQHWFFSHTTVSSGLTISARCWSVSASLLLALCLCGLAVGLMKAAGKAITGYSEKNIDAHG